MSESGSAEECSRITGGRSAYMPVVMPARNGRGRAGCCIAGAERRLPVMSVISWEEMVMIFTQDENSCSRQIWRELTDACLQRSKGRRQRNQIETEAIYEGLY